ncbi:hypothetical protein BDN70DRAFT_312256 [Pholiota conissans]|uniref:Uncharacterized protein n=1 Tax=Pholiota conissans TaxID=109636 RepID=A0A9P5YS76_9AGAR|nr:hypothetical protein BDN70DRAFT_312256 [Pholiota conissans]
MTLSRPLSLDEYHLIINALAQLPWHFRPSALRYMCLTHRSFIPLCQRFIFQIIVYDPDKVDAFLEIIQNSPHLALYPQEFYLTFSYRSASVLASRQHEKTVRYLDTFKYLRVLTVSGASESKHAVGRDWNMLNPQVCEALLRLIHSPSLETLEVSRFVNFPLQGLLKLKSSANIRSLSITTLRVDIYAKSAIQIAPIESTNTSALEATSPDTPLTRLLDFTVGTNSASALEVLMGTSSASRHYNSPVLEFGHLRKINTSWENNLDAKTGKSMIAASLCLEEITCILSNDSDATYKGLADSILAGSFQTLRELKIYTYEPLENEYDPFHGSVQEIAKLAERVDRLETITMRFQHYTAYAADAPFGLCEAIEAGCNALDKVFVNRSAFPSLRSLAINFLVSILDDPSFGIYVLEQKFAASADGVEGRTFQNVKSIPDIEFEFNVNMEWTPEG